MAIYTDYDGYFGDPQTFYIDAGEGVLTVERDGYEYNVDLNKIQDQLPLRFYSDTNCKVGKGGWVSISETALATDGAGNHSWDPGTTDDINGTDTGVLWRYGVGRLRMVVTYPDTTDENGQLLKNSREFVINLDRINFPFTQGMVHNGGRNTADYNCHFELLEGYMAHD